MPREVGNRPGHQSGPVGLSIAAFEHTAASGTNTYRSEFARLACSTEAHSGEDSAEVGQRSLPVEDQYV